MNYPWYITRIGSGYNWTYRHTWPGMIETHHKSTYKRAEQRKHDAIARHRKRKAKR